MSRRTALYALLLVVAAAAAVLSFSALRDLALLCGFAASLAWLLPVVLDTGATAGAVAWLGRHEGPGRAFGRRLALALLAASVAGNALGHGLAAYRLAPAWWVVVLVSAVAPAVLGAVVHLAVLVGRGDAVPPAPPAPTSAHLVELVESPAELETTLAELESDPVTSADEVETWEARRDRLLADGAGRPRLMRELGIGDWEARQLITSRTRARQEESG